MLGVVVNSVVVVSGASVVEIVLDAVVIDVVVVVVVVDVVVVVVDVVDVSTSGVDSSSSYSSSSSSSPFSSSSSSSPAIVSSSGRPELGPSTAFTLTDGVVLDSSTLRSDDVVAGCSDESLLRNLRLPLFLNRKTAALLLKTRGFSDDVSALFVCGFLLATSRGRRVAVGSSVDDSISDDVEDG